MKTETLETEKGDIFTLTETGGSFIIETEDSSETSAGFGLRLEITKVFCTRETAIKAFEAVCTAL